MSKIQYREVKKKSSLFLAMTGLKLDEFEELALHFGNSWHKLYPSDRLGRGRPPVISSMEDRLLFILYYYKNYPLEEIQGFLFGISQERASECIQLYGRALQEALRKGGFAPERLPSELQKKLLLG